jgi:hypothetical protein
MERYKNGKIYKIVCNITGKVYIGSTCKKLLSQRLTQHVWFYKKWKINNKNYTTSFEIIEGDNYYIKLIELVSCSCRDELLMKERYYIENNECVNKFKKPIATVEEKKESREKYREEHKEIKANYDKDYNEKNIDIIKEKKKVYREMTKEKIKEVNKYHREKNKEKNKEYMKEYRELNKEKNKEYQKKYKEKKTNSLITQF